ncbi:MAG: DNA double-strand break repair nuclease NurA [Haloquadratum sp.]|nr:DNA double-strand break repair nuclease NurA [Haloferacaceae archaeon]MDR9445266.1 DNA double-strand break repair nuclease NurA [Haloquadratum sp.]
MSLDRVHIDALADAAATLAGELQVSHPSAAPQTLFTEALDPLVDAEGVTCLEAVDPPTVQTVRLETAAGWQPPVSAVHGIDAGTINPTTFRNGLVIDAAQAAMASDPVDVALHRRRTLVATAHIADGTVDVTTDWQETDGGHGRFRMIQAPQISRYAEGVVHALALYLAEGAHALEHIDAIQACLVLDGPLYPLELLRWRAGEDRLRTVAATGYPTEALWTYLTLIDRLISTDRLVFGFVKNPSARGIVATLRARGETIPWVTDTAFFAELLAEQADDTQLVYTSWFRSSLGADAAITQLPAVVDVDLAGPAAGLHRCFMMLYDPREAVVYRVDAPTALVDDPTARAQIERIVLQSVAVEAGPPTVIRRADHLARIGRGEKVRLQRRFARMLDSAQLRRYDDVRWGLTDRS